MHAIFPFTTHIHVTTAHIIGPVTTQRSRTVSFCSFDLSAVSRQTRMQYEQSVDVDMIYDEGLQCLVQVASTSELFIENHGSQKKEGGGGGD